jgi:hypothetical protein
MTYLVAHFSLNWILRRGNPLPCASDRLMRQELLRRAQRALRTGKLELAKCLLEECGDSHLHDAACLNVLGLIAEAGDDWKSARRHWRSAVRADRSYAPAWQNIRRHFELFNWGQSRLSAAFAE